VRRFFYQGQGTGDRGQEAAPASAFTPDTSALPSVASLRLTFCVWRQPSRVSRLAFCISPLASSVSRFASCASRLAPRAPRLASRVSRFASCVSRLAPLLVLLATFLACANSPATSSSGKPRWVSLSPSMTEILFAVGAGPEVVGVCAPASFPPEASALPAVASWDRLDAERVLALHPTCCFTVEGMQPPHALGALKRLGVEVVIYPMTSLEDLWACVEAVGRRTGHPDQGRDVAAGLRARVAAAGMGLEGPPRRALVVVGLDPIVAAGPGSFLNDVLKAAGYTNALTGAADTYPTLSLEDAVKARPDAVIFPKGEIPPRECEAFAGSLRTMEDAPISAVAVPADLLVRPGPRTAQAVEILARERRRQSGEGKP